MAKKEAVEGATPTPEGAKATKKKKTFKKRGEKRVVHHGYAYIHASFNNTTITITDTDGNVIAWSSAGGSGGGGGRRPWEGSCSRSPRWGRYSRPFPS